MTKMRTLRKGDTGDEVIALQKALKLYPDGIFGAITVEAVKAVQLKYGIEVDGIVGPMTWAVLQGVAVKKSRRVISEIIVHCTATKEGVNVTVPQIRAWHKQRGFADIGYHYVVYLDGSVHEGRDVNLAGAHCTNHNARSIGVCYVGGLDANGKAKDTRTETQKAALVKLIKQLKDMYPKATVHGHREYANKDCPCFNAWMEYKDL